jgi:propanediol dehydratase large subunit
MIQLGQNKVLFQASINTVTNLRVSLKQTAPYSEISSSHGGEYDVQNCLLGCTAV